MKEGRAVTERTLECPLLSVGPMSKVGLKGSSDETTEFSAQVQAHHIQEIFLYYGVSVDEWSVCQIADNCRLNKKIGKILDIPMVGCYSHRIHQAARQMCRKDFVLAAVIESVSNTMNDFK